MKDNHLSTDADPTLQSATEGEMSTIPITRCARGCEISVPVPLNLKAGPMLVKFVGPDGETYFSLRFDPDDLDGIGTQVMLEDRTRHLSLALDRIGLIH
jgi:hypothetical protein